MSTEIPSDASELQAETEAIETVGDLITPEISERALQEAEKNMRITEDVHAEEDGTIPPWVTAALVTIRQARLHSDRELAE